jgi:hypothetical protein
MSESELYEKNGSEAREYVATVTSMVQLRTLLLEEVGHPKFEGGRSGVLSAIRKQLDDVGAEIRRTEIAARPPAPRVKYKIVVPNVTDDRGDPIAQGTPCSIGAPPPGGVHLSPEKFRFFVKIGAIEEVVG